MTHDDAQGDAQRSMRLSSRLEAVGVGGEDIGVFEAGVLSQVVPVAGAPLWGSMSSRTVRCPACSARAEIAQERVVLPAPPFWESTARTGGRPGAVVATGVAGASVGVVMSGR